MWPDNDEPGFAAVEVVKNLILQVKQPGLVIKTVGRDWLQATFPKSRDLADC